MNLLPYGQLLTRSLAVIVVVMTCGPSLPDTASADENWAKKMFSETEHDFRTVGRGTTAEHYFQFQNLYEETVHVAAVRSSCGCTTPTVSRDTLATHETGAIVAKFNTSTFIGSKAATLTIVFDQPFYAEVQLQVRGNIRTDITFDPPEMDFGEAKPSETITRSIKISHRGNSQWRIQDVRSHCSDLAVKLSTPQTRPGIVEYEMEVRMKESMPEGDIHEQLTLVTNDSQFPSIEMSVTGRVRSAVSISPAAVSLGTSTPGQTTSKRLLVRADEPFAIREVRCADKRFSFEIPKGKKKIQFVQMTFTAGDSADSITQKIEIVTDLPGDKAAACVATGTVR